MKFLLINLYGNPAENHDGLKTDSIHAEKRQLPTNYKPWPRIGGAIALSVVVLSTLVFVIKVLVSMSWLRAESAARVLSCYYSLPAANASAPQLLAADVEPRLCTHINLAFAAVRDKRIHLEESQAAAVRDVIKLKRKNPHLKVLLSVGGAGENNGFSDMVVDHASRKVFIKSIKITLKNYSLDGIDLDWEFPAFHYTDARLGAGEFPAFHYTDARLRARERQHFSQLLREIRMEYLREKRDYILTVALAAPQTIVDVSYDIDQINLYVDYANIMTYDFHYFTKFTPFTGFNSPLFARSSEELYLATLNINYTIHMYEQKGLDRNKIVVGIPTYGHTFQLVNPENPTVGSPATGFGKLGGLGFADYTDICRFNSSQARRVTEVFEAEARVPYLYSGTEWVSFESERSVAEKAAYVVQGGLRGAMLYSLNADDYAGRCARTAGGRPRRFPLAAAVRAVLVRS